MPTVTFNLMDTFREDRFDAASPAVDLEYTGTPAGAVLRCLILSALTIDQNTDVTIGDCAVFTEVTGTGYPAGGNALDNAIVTLDGSGNVDIDADDPDVWVQDGSGFTNARFAVIAFDNGGAQSTWPLVGYSADFGADKGNQSGDFTVTLHATGLFRAPR